MLGGAHDLEDKLVRKLERMRPEELDVSLDRPAFYARIRAELHQLVHALARRDFEEALASIRAQDDAEGHAWTEERLEQALAPYFAEYGTLVFGPSARATDKTKIVELGDHHWSVQHTLVDPQDDGFWFIDGEVDLRDDHSPEGPLVRVLRIGT
jgi:hypothetical protein